MSEAIHGITFIDYAAANAQLAQGKDISELLPILGVEMPQWEEASEHWLGKLMDDTEMTYSAKYGEIFSNPAQGKFANYGAESSTDALSKIPTIEDFIDLMCLTEVATKYGIDSQFAMGEVDINVAEYSQASMHYMPMLGNGGPEWDDTEWLEYFTSLMETGRKKYEARFSAEAGGSLGDDIEF